MMYTRAKVCACTYTWCEVEKPYSYMKYDYALYSDNYSFFFFYTNQQEQLLYYCIEDIYLLYKSKISKFQLVL